MVGDGLGDSAGVGRGESVAVGLAVGDGLGDSVRVGRGESVTVGSEVGVSGRSGDSVGAGIVAVGVSGRMGVRVGLGIVAVGVGNTLSERDAVTVGRSGEPLPPHEISTRVTTARPAVCVHERHRDGKVESSGWHLMGNS